MSPFNTVLEWDLEDRVWVSHVPDLGGISTYGDTLEEVVERTRVAILGYQETAAEQGLPLPARTLCATIARVAPR